jgi:predicted O-linked N-acetylglucosamine transferase (SPINDLY family)
MRILGIVDKSILLLSAHNNLIVSNLKNEAIKNSINPERLVFLERLQNVEDHLERQKIADLMLDTFPYNGHTTTIDALWSGVPVLTLQGEGFHARVASSLLYTVGLSELIVTTQRDYELKAIEMGFNSDKLQVIRSKLSENKVNSLLFNTHLYTKNLEEAFDLMFIRLKHGLPPEDLNVKVSHE